MGGHQVGVQRARAAADNSYNQDVDEEPSFVLHVPFNVFHDLIKKSFVDSASPISNIASPGPLRLLLASVVVSSMFVTLQSWRNGSRCP